MAGESEIMGTRSNIYIETEPGTYLGTYCHYDGYPEHMLKALGAIDNDKLTGHILQAIPRSGFRRFDPAHDRIERFNDNEIVCVTNPCADDEGVEYIYIKQYDGTIKWRSTMHAAPGWQFTPG